MKGNRNSLERRRRKGKTIIPRDELKEEVQGKRGSGKN